MKTILSLGAGVQSSTLALMAAHGEITPMPDASIFADVQAEAPEVYEWLDWLEGELPFPVHRITAGDLKREASDVRTSKNTGKRYWRSQVPYFSFRPARTEIAAPEDSSQADAWGEAATALQHPASKGMLWRHCTVDYKIKPINRLLKKMLKESGEDRLFQWLGISTDEIQRMKTNREPFIENQFPLIDNGISRADCIKWMATNKYPEPPRSACWFCPYHSDDEWVRLKENSPDLFARAGEYERLAQKSASQSETLAGIPYLHSSCVPIGEVDFKAKTDPRQVSWMDECEGMCSI